MESSAHYEVMCPDTPALRIVSGLNICLDKTLDACSLQGDAGHLGRVSGGHRSVNLCSGQSDAGVWTATCKELG